MPATFFPVSYLKRDQFNVSFLSQRDDNHDTSPFPPHPISLSLCLSLSVSPSLSPSLFEEETGSCRWSIGLVQVKCLSVHINLKLMAVHQQIICSDSHIRFSESKHVIFGIFLQQEFIVNEEPAMGMLGVLII